MKILFLGLLTILSTVVFAQKIVKTKRASRYSIHVFGDNFEGVIFKKGYNPYKKMHYSALPSDTTKREGFTPSSDEIELTEKFLQTHLDTLSDLSGQNVKIQRTLGYYVRQYFGYLNKKNEKIIFVNCFYKSDTNIYRNKKEWQKSIVSVWDGGMAFWRIKFNLNKRKLYDFYVNGI